MKLDTTIFQKLLEQAKTNPRLRQALDLRSSGEDKSQRLLNALQPGTIVPIHRHKASIETAVILYGHIDEVYYNENGEEQSRHSLRIGEGLQIPVGQFHTVEVHEPSILLEIKDGAYAPLTPEDILTL